MATASSIGHQNKCQHPACLCQAEPGKSYCSEYCSAHDLSAAGPGAKRDGTCGCGHPACEHLGTRE
jgi:hypothetical protein